ncbi:MAG: DEAD/DEAH box helicase [Gemmatimonadales bacterium]
MHPSRDHQLPVDPAAYRAARHPRGRVIVIAPTRAACETIELALGTEIETLLMREHGPTLVDWAERRQAFGIVAGTGTGKTLAVRPIAQALLGESLRYGVVNREREATPETPTWNVVVVTTGIARRWFQDELISGRDTLVVDEIHQTSAELELCLALGKRAGCRFIWLSATVDPSFYSSYLRSDHVLETSAFDPALRARVEVVAKDVDDFLDERYIRKIIREGRGVAVFVPTRAEVERLAGKLGARWNRLNAAFYHGGEPIRVIRPFLEGQVEKPFLLAMTAAGQSAINVPGLDTVVIYDARYGNVVDRGRNVLHRLYLGANEILQMAGRVHGRVARGEVSILTNRPLRFQDLRPTPPDFQLAGDAERVALTCAAIGVDATDLELPVPLDKVAYRRALEVLTTRGLVAGGRLTDFGRDVEAMPVERPWGELLVKADPQLAPVLAVAASVDSLHRMTREDRDLHGVAVPGSDHLTTYNIYAEAVNRFGSVGKVYGLERHLFGDGFDEWAEERGVLAKAIEDAAMGMASIYRSLELGLPRGLPYATKDLRQRFVELVAEVMPFDLVIDEETADGQDARVSKTSLAGTWGAIAGSIRYFADRFGTPRASIEGTTIPLDLVRRFAIRGNPVVAVAGPRKHQGFIVTHTLSYHGFELETIDEPLSGQVPEALRASAVDALVDGLVEGSVAHADHGRVRRAVRSLDEYWRRSGGSEPAVAPDRIREALRAELEGVDSWRAFQGRSLDLDAERFLPAGRRAALDALPGTIHLLGDATALEYAIERGQGVVRLRLREGQARRLNPGHLPDFDRPVRFLVARGGEAPLEAESLEALGALLRKPSPKVHPHRHRKQKRRIPKPGRRRR